MTATDSSPTRSGQSQTTSALTLGQFTEARLLVPRLLNTGQEGVIQELAKRLETTGRIPSATAFVEAVTGRELDCPTFVGDRVAVPHGRGGAVRALSLAVGLSADGIPWGRDHRRNAHIVFLFAIPLPEAARYLALLSGLSCLLHDVRMFAALKGSRQPEQMLQVLDAVRMVRRASRAPAPCRS